MIDPKLLALQTTFSTRPFGEAEAAQDPFVQFRAWFDEALQAGVAEANAMVAATSNTDGQPAARVVLLRNLDDRGFVFFTNYESHKGQDIALNPRIELLFYWQPLGRQVRISGSVEKVDRADSIEYFNTRPFASRVGAWASKQSSVLQSREELDERVQHFEQQYANGDVPIPDYWGGYRVLPLALEFWQGRESRLHDRIRYRRTSLDSLEWIRERLSP